MRAALCLMIAIAMTSAARADSNRDEVWLGGSARALRSASANALTGANLAGTSLGVARDLGLGDDTGLAVWAVASLVTGDADGTMFDTLTTELSSIGVTGGVRVRYQLHRLIAASARVELGGQRIRVALTDRSGASASDHGWGAVASVGAALDVFAVARPPLGLGLRVELGYVVGPSIAITPRAASAGDALRLPMTELALGGVDLRGPTFALSAVGQF